MYEQEVNVIGTLLRGGGKFAFDVLEADDFTDFQLCKVFSELKILNDKGKGLDYIELSKKIGISVPILAGFSIDSIEGSFEGCVESIKKNSAQRKFRSIIGAERDGDIDDIIDDVVLELQGINLYRTNKSKDMQSIALDYVDLLSDREKNAGKEARSGLPKLDRTLGGFHKKEFTIIGARPSVGKSAFGLQIACNIAKSKKVLFVSLEMADVQIMERMVSKYSGLEHWKLKTGRLERDDWSKVSESISYVERLDLQIDTSIRTVNQLRTKLLSARPDIVIVDYIGLMQDTSKRFKDKREEMSSITHKLKAMALDYDIPIIALAQLGRDTQDRKPMLNNLRDSGSLEEDADNVIFLHRLSTKDEENFMLRGTDETAIPMLIMIEKQRNGEQIWIKAIFRGSKFQFTEVE